MTPARRTAATARPAPQGPVLQVVGMVGGGAGTHLAQVSRGLHESGLAVWVAGPPTVLARLHLPPGRGRAVPVQIGDRPGRADAATVRRLRRAARHVRLVHAHGLRAGALAALALLRLPVPLVVTLHNAAPSARAARAVFGALARLVAQRADVVLVVSDDLAALMHRLGAQDVRPAVVAAPPAKARVDPDRVRTELGDPALLVVAVARLAPQKDLDVLLTAAAGLPAGVLVAVAGDGPLRESLQRRIDDEHLPVRLLGRRDDVPDLLSAADLAVSTARWEGQPVWLQEALRAGLPVLATDAGGTRAVLRDAGHLVPVGDTAALRAALHRLVEDAGERSRLASAADSVSRRLPDERAAVDGLLGVYAQAQHDMRPRRRGRSRRA